jgi:hypothetical protein
MSFDGNYEDLAREMDQAARQLDELPEDLEWTPEQLAKLEDVRHAALKLARVVEATIETFEGHQDGAPQQRAARRGPLPGRAGREKREAKPLATAPVATETT